MRLFYYSCVLIGSFFLVSGCRVKTTSSVDSNYFKEHTTFGWMPETTSVVKFDRETKRKQLEIEIKKEVENAMKANGFVYDSVNPSVIVNFKAVYEKDRTGNKVNKSSLTGYTGGSAVNLNTLPIPQNTLAVLIQLVEPSTKQILWSGYTIRSTGEVLTLVKIVNDDVKRVVRKVPKRKYRLQNK